MTPTEVSGVIGAVLAFGMLAERVASRLAAPAVAPRETSLPPAPSSGPHAGSLLDGTLAAIVGRVTVLERREELAQAKREEMAETLTRIETKLDERTSRRKDPHANREST